MHINAPKPFIKKLFCPLFAFAQILPPSAQKPFLLFCTSAPESCSPLFCRFFLYCLFAHYIIAFLILSPSP
ncbi:hypothetical protein COU37_00395 [Candidatus Micrarchaeota archaeon CG10_big_fil_rev_8_21_14_0_10_45_29]|nr:MAG: hypothetical protein COU37_00395 [Candidatus Micrarchaeota archaeon CG10_big_fil_rev_8_21_14_0_10_45_29]